MTSISAERSSLAKIGSGLIRREQWGARFNYGSARTVTEPAKQIFIHITVTNPSNYRSHAAHVRAIEAIGISRFGATGISYNRIILFGVDRAYEGQPVGRRGAHTVNDHRRSRCNRWGGACPGNGGDLTAPSWNNNYTARAYAYGALTQHSVTDSVLDTFARAIADDIKAGFVRRDAKIHGHRCLSSKSCPGDHMWARMHALRRLVDNYLSDTLEDDMSKFGPENWDAADKKAAREALHGENHFTKYVLMSEDKNLGWHLRHIVDRVDTLISVINSYSDSKIQRPDVDGKTSGMRWALERVWEDTHELRTVPDELEALRAGILGGSADEIKALIETKHAEAEQQRQVIADTMTTKLDAVVEATQGSDPAEAKLAAILEILGVNA